MIVSLINYHYPFGEAPVTSPQIIVEQILAFPSSKALQQKKSQIVKKREIITNPSLIKLLKVHSQGLQLHSLYEYVPYTLTSFLQMKLTTQTKDVWEMTKNLFLKKLTYELTMLIAYLAKMKIEVDLTPHNLGINQEQKLKLYISNRCKMGHKTEVRLISFYGKCKQKIREFIEQYFESIPDEPETPINFKIKGNKLEFDQNTSLDAESDINYSKLHDNFRRSNLSGVRSPNKTKNNIRRKMSSGNFEFGIRSPNPQQQDNHYSVRQPRTHKYSFQCQQPRMNTETFDNPNTTYEQEEKEEPEHEPKFAQSKHVKIELEQTQNDNFDIHGQKQRKNSYKVKITTFRQYEVDNCDPEELFRPEDAEKDDIFEYFAQRAKREEEEKQRERQQQEHRQAQTEVRYSSPSARFRQRKTTFQTQNTHASPTSQSYLAPPNARGSFPSSEKQSAKQQLGDRIKNAKERAQKVLSQIKRYKNSL